MFLAVCNAAAARGAAGDGARAVAVHNHSGRGDGGAVAWQCVADGQPQHIQDGVQCASEGVCMMAMGLGIR